MSMTEQEERSFLTQRVILVGLSILAVAGLLFGAFFAGGSRTGIRLLFSRAAANSAGGLDTPVVLVGGSLSFKAGSQKGTLQWTPVPGCSTPCTEYFLDPGYPVSTIALKNSSDDDPNDPNDPPAAPDNNPAKDKIRVDISNASTWEIDEYTSVNSVDTQVALIKPSAAGTTEIHVKFLAGAPGGLCLTRSKRIMYSPTGACPASGPVTDAVTFSKVTLQIDNGSNVTTSSGSLSCVDDSSKPTLGHCRIVFRGSN